jgi:peptidoglycan/LPS O-acetylase OafA/YrhL
MMSAVAGIFLAAVNFSLIPSVTFELYTKALTPSLAPLSLALLIPAALTLKAPGIFAQAAAWLSTRTYAIYLFHRLIIVFTYASSNHPTMRLVMFVMMTGLLADFLYRYIERPFMRLRPLRAPVSSPAPAE